VVLGGLLYLSLLVASSMASLDVTNPALTPSLPGQTASMIASSASSTALQVGLGKMHLPTSKYAYATLLTQDNPGYLIGTLMLGRSLRETGSLKTADGKNIDLVVLITAERNFADSSVKAMKDEGFSVVRVNEVPSPFPREKCGRYCDFYIKLRLWQLPYDKVVYLDCDMLVRRNVNDLFTIKLGAWPAAAAVPECSPQRLPVNGGFYVLEPSENTFKDMYSLRGKIEGPLIQSGQQWEYTEQTFLHAYFRRCFFDQNCDGSHLTRLPASYNVRMKMGHTDCDGDSSLPTAHAWHFAGTPKPWDDESLPITPESNRKYFTEYRKKRVAWGI